MVAKKHLGTLGLREVLAFKTSHPFRPPNTRWARRSVLRDGPQGERAEREKYCEEPNGISHGLEGTIGRTTLREDRSRGKDARPRQLFRIRKNTFENAIGRDAPSTRRNGECRSPERCAIPRGPWIIETTPTECTSRYRSALLPNPRESPESVMGNSAIPCVLRVCGGL